jgi:two-component system NtrC family sensor kinase
VVEKLSVWRHGLRLRTVLVIGFALTTAITVMVGALLTYSLINNYLEEAQDERVGRDMDLANAFYNSKLDEISSMAGRLASVLCVQEGLPMAVEGDGQAIQIINDTIDNEIANLAKGAQRFVIVTNAQGETITGRVSANGELGEVDAGSDWSSVPIADNALLNGKAQSATEVIPSGVLQWLGLDEQARIPLIDTPRAAPAPYDRREGTAGLVLLAAAPIISRAGDLEGSVLVGHLFNNDFTLVDRIKEVAGVDTATIFFGDLRVSTNVLDEEGNRAIGTRVSQEVFDQGLVAGQDFTGEAFVVNQNYITRYQPLYDHRGQIVGMLYVGAKQASFQRLLDVFRSQVLLIAGATIMLAIFIAIPLAWSISRPMTELAGATREVAEGNWSVRVPVAGYEEMRTLAQSFNVMVGTLKDTQEQLIQKEKLASVGQLAAGVAHEINNPLGSILLYADILRKETPDEDQQQQDDLDMIIREATRCKTIVNDLLDFSRQNEIMAQDTNVNELLQELVEDAKRQEIFRQITIRSALAPDLPTIQADPLQLRQVFLNLICNSAEAMPEGGQLTLRTLRGPLEGCITVEVQDTGTGIPEEDMSKLFTPFFTTKPIGKGTGLGLAIIYGIVKMHRGQISVQSEEGVGTTFSVVLNVQLPDSGAPKTETLILS